MTRRGQRTSGPAAIAGKSPTELYNVDQKAVTDALSKLPSSYEGLNVPRPAPRVARGPTATAPTRKLALLKAGRE